MVESIAPYREDLVAIQVQKFQLCQLFKVLLENFHDRAVVRQDSDQIREFPVYRNGKIKNVRIAVENYRLHLLVESFAESVVSAINDRVALHVTMGLLKYRLNSLASQIFPVSPARAGNQFWEPIKIGLDKFNVDADVSFQLYSSQTMQPGENSAVHQINFVEIYLKKKFKKNLKQSGLSWTYLFT